MDRACCEYLCLIDATCVGFARLKNVTDDAKGDCLLETNVTENRIWNHTDWHTFIFD